MTITHAFNPADDLMLHAPSPVRRGARAAPVVLDLVHLRTYTLGDAALEREILALFLGELPTYVAALQTATTAKEWHMATHTLKGSALAIGAGRLAAASASAERLDLPSAVDRAAVISSITHAIHDIRDAVARLG